MPAVSILVPVYNVESYLPKALDSLTNQTFQDIEIICINDGSTDRSLQILRAYAAQDPRIRIYSFPNSGISKTRNRALALARGEFIMFVDSDDYLDTRAVEVMLKEALEKDLDFVQCSFVMEYALGNFYRPGSGHRQFTNIEALHALSQSRWLNNYPWGKLIRRSCFDGVRFPEDVKGFEDTFTIFKSLIPARRAGTIPERFYHYVQHRGSLTNRMSLDTVYLMRQAYEYQAAYLKKVFPEEHFSFDLQYYNTDMVIIYTLILFCRRKDHPAFVEAEIDWARLPVPLAYEAAYKAWLEIARLKLGDALTIEKGTE